LQQTHSLNHDDRSAKDRGIPLINRSERNTKGLIAEGIAIVLSILLAFAIDAWWDERQERSEEKEVLKSIYIEFKTNRDEAAAVILTHERAIHSIARLQQLTPDEILMMPSESVEETIGFFATPATFDAVRGSVDALTSSGKLRILQDRELREALMTFVTILDDAIEDRNYMAQTSMTVWNEMAKNGGPWRKNADQLTEGDCTGSRPHRACYINEMLAYLPAATAQDLLRLRNNKTLMGYVNQNKSNAARYASEVRQAVLQIDFILTLLEKNLASASQ
jgi:hypothetical protein